MTNTINNSLRFGLCLLGAGMIQGNGFSVMQAQTTPNIVLFFLDDMGYGDLTLTGASGYATPAIDRLASDGMFFTHFYAAQAVSSASRGGLMTGCYPNRIGLSGALMPQSKSGLNPEEETIAEVLKKKGYTCGMVGKWHLGHHYPFMPLQNGFDDYLGLPYSNDMWPVDYEGNRLTAESTHMPDRMNYPPLPLIDGNEKVSELWTLDEQSQLTTIYTERAVGFIEKQKDKPFFLYIAHSMPHVPLAVSAKFKNKSNQGIYGDVMMEIDWSVAQVMNALDRHGLAENTLVIFASDNGPWMNFGNHAGSNGGLRGGKFHSFEGGQRVPCLMRWKGVIPEGKVCNQLASTIDILPTLAEITGAQLPEQQIDGVSILPLLKGENNVSPRKHFLYYYRQNDLEAVRDERFKLVFPHTYDAYLEPANDGFPGQQGKEEIALSLYDLRRDPGERTDVKALYPEAVERLQQVAEEARKDLGDNIEGQKGSNRRPLGRIE